MIRQFEEGGLPKQTAKETLKALNDLRGEIINPFKVLGVLNKYIPKKLLQEHYAEPRRILKAQTGGHSFHVPDGRITWTGNRRKKE